MTVAEIKEYIDEQSQKNKFSCYEELRARYYSVLADLEEMLDELDYEWVDVSDAKKPEKDEKVLIQVDDYTHTATYDKDEDVWKLNHNEYSMHSTKFKNFYDIAKWKKIEPYKESELEENK